MSTKTTIFQQLVFALAVPAVLLSTSCGNPDRSAQTDGADSAAADEPRLTLLWKTDSVFTGSESTLYDAGKDIIYVSCGNTVPDAKDGDGFIALLNTDGSTKELKWVTGLHAPKGMTLLKGKLYVADIDEIKVIDVDKAEIASIVPIDGSVFLNDVTNDGTKIYFSDTRAGNIYSMEEDGAYEVVRQNNEKINGLAYFKNQLYGLDGQGLQQYEDVQLTATLLNSEVTGGDGLVVINDSTFIASRWAGEIYFIKGSVATKLLDTKEEKSNTADIDYINNKNTVLVPTFMKNEVAAYELTY